MRKNIFANNSDQIYCPRCGDDSVVKNGRYLVKGGKRESIQRRLCKKCGAKFNDGTVYVPKEPTSIYQAKKPKIIYKAHLHEKAELRLELLKNFIQTNGFPKIGDVKKSLGMSVSSYYRTLLEVVKENEKLQRSYNKNFDSPKILLLEFKKINRTTGQKIKFYLLIDLVTQRILATFILQKKSQKLLNQMTKPMPLFDFYESINIYDLYNKISEAKKIMPDLIIYCACDSRINRNLVKKFSNFIEKCTSEIKNKYICDLKKSGFNRTVSFTKTLVQIAPKEIARTQNYDLQKRKSRTTDKAQFLNKDIMKTVRFLSYVYNQSKKDR